MSRAHPLQSVAQTSLQHFSLQSSKNSDLTEITLFHQRDFNFMAEKGSVCLKRRRTKEPTLGGRDRAEERGGRGPGHPRDIVLPTWSRATKPGRHGSGLTSTVPGLMSIWCRGHLVLWLT